MASMTHFQSMRGWRKAERTFQAWLYSVMRTAPASRYHS